MTEPWGRLRLDVVDDEIIITLPGTSYSVTYFKRANSPQLLARNISQTDDLRTLVTLSDFLSRAWRVANDKARELRKGVHCTWNPLSSPARTIARIGSQHCLLVSPP